MNRRSYKGKNNPNYGKRGKKSPNWLGGKSKGKKCIDCLKLLSVYKATRCSRCANKGRHNPNYKGGISKIIAHCKNCKQKLGYYESKLCKKCEMIRRLETGLIKKSLNKPEKQLNKFLKSNFPNKYKYIGNWKFSIAGLCPDFINKKQNKIIELYGDYWHNLTKQKIIDKRRLQVYKKYGYKTLIIWEHELKNLVKIKQKIIKFERKYNG